jgi:hypothetical protein
MSRLSKDVTIKKFDKAIKIEQERKNLEVVDKLQKGKEEYMFDRYRRLFTR